jgi:hypothetical protein
VAEYCLILLRKQPLRLVNYFDSILAQRPKIRCEVEFQTGGCHYADEPIYVGHALPLVAR